VNKDNQNLITLLKATMIEGNNKLKEDIRKDTKEMIDPISQKVDALHNLVVGDGSVPSLPVRVQALEDHKEAGEQVKVATVSGKWEAVVAWISVVGTALAGVVMLIAKMVH